VRLCTCGIQPFPPLSRESVRSPAPSRGASTLRILARRESHHVYLSPPARRTLPPHSCRVRPARRHRPIVRSASDPHRATRPLPPRDRVAARDRRTSGAGHGALSRLRRSPFFKGRTAKVLASVGRPMVGRVLGARCTLSGPLFLRRQGLERDPDATPVIATAWAVVTPVSIPALGPILVEIPMVRVTLNSRCPGVTVSPVRMPAIAIAIANHSRRCGARHGSKSRGDKHSSGCELYSSFHRTHCFAPLLKCSDNNVQDRR
jgi:hypothetical protein